MTAGCSEPVAGGVLEPAPAALVIAEARRWVGTPYLHQASTRGAGCDCLGLARGIWRALHGAEAGPIPAYTPFWGETGRREVLLEALRAHLIGIAPDLADPGTLLVFRMAPGRLRAAASATARRRKGRSRPSWRRRTGSEGSSASREGARRKAAACGWPRSRRARGGRGAGRHCSEPRALPHLLPRCRPLRSS